MTDRRLAALVLFAFSVVPVVQQIRSAVFEIDGEARYEEHYVDSLPIRFARRTVRIADDQLHTGDGLQAAVRGLASILVDGRPISSSADVRVRPGLENLARYHRWVTAGAFTDRVSGARFLLVSRLRGDPNSPRIELLRIDENGHMSVRTGTYAMRSESFPEYRVIRALGDETKTVFDFQYWMLPPFVALSVLGPWVGLLASMIWLLWDWRSGRPPR